MVWNTTTKVGYGVAEAPSPKYSSWGGKIVFVVAKYKPAGNMGGSYTMNVNPLANASGEYISSLSTTPCPSDAVNKFFSSEVSSVSGEKYEVCPSSSARDIFSSVLTVSERDALWLVNSFPVKYGLWVIQGYLISS